MYQPLHDPPVIWLLCGGPSPEYKVSLSSATTVAANLDRKSYHVLPVCVRQCGDWWFARKPLSPEADETAVKNLFESFAEDQPGEHIEALAVNRMGERLQRQAPDCALVMVHGEWGEDGVLQGMLETLGIPYTGSGVLASALCMDKILCQKLLDKHGIPVPPHVALDMKNGENMDDIIATIESEIGCPCFVKPSNGGSSIGITLVKKVENLKSALRVAAQYDRKILVEKKLEGSEVTCGVLDLVKPDGTMETVTFPPTEIVPLKGEYFDYECKYVAGSSSEITPARFEPKALDEIRAIAQRVHSILGCEGFSRVDMIKCGDALYVFEINTIPGMTGTSLLPQGAKAYGLDLTQLCDQMIRFAWWRHQNNA